MNELLRVRSHNETQSVTVKSKSKRPSAPVQQLSDLEDQYQKLVRSLNETTDKQLRAALKS